MLQLVHLVPINYMSSFSFFVSSTKLLNLGTLTVFNSVAKKLRGVLKN